MTDSFKTLMVVLIGISVLSSCWKKESEQPQEALPVKVFVVKSDSLTRYISLTAGLEGLRETRLLAQMPGKLDRVQVTVGQAVQADAILGNIENRLQKQQVQQARAALEMAQSALELAEKDYQRIQQLASGKAVTPQQLEQARSRYQQAHAQVQQARAALELAREQLRNSMFIAPFDGVVASIFVDEGSFVPMGQPVFRLVATHALKANLSISEKYWRDVHARQRVEGIFPDIPDTVFIGRILWKETAIDPLSRTFDARVIFNNADGRLRSGMFGRFRIAVERVTKMPVVPDNAISSRTEVAINPQTGESQYLQKHYVFVVKQGVARRVPVQIALESDSRVAIARGLQPGDSLIVVGQKLVKDGQPVRVVN